MSNKIEACPACDGEGAIHAGIEEFPETWCNKCDGSGSAPVSDQAVGERWEPLGEFAQVRVSAADPVSDDELPLPEPTTHITTGKGLIWNGKTVAVYTADQLRQDRRDYHAHMLRKMAGPVEVKVERNRVWIVNAHQSFMLAYEADTAEELNWYADQLRGALSGFTPDVNEDRQKLECEAKEAIFGLSNLLRHATTDHAWCADVEKPHLVKALAAVAKLAQARAAGDDTIKSQKALLDNAIAEINHLERELNEFRAAGAERDGWKLVPVEPNDAMQAAGAQAIRFDTTVLNKLWTGNAVFRAMLAAAPSADDPECWSCKQPYTMQERADADGHCPQCGVEIELDETSAPNPAGARADEKEGK